MRHLAFLYITDIHFQKHFWTVSEFLTSRPQGWSFLSPEYGISRWSASVFSVDLWWICLGGEPTARKWVSSPHKWIKPTEIPCQSLGLYPTFEPWVLRHQVCKIFGCGVI